MSTNLDPFHYPAILIKKRAWSFSLISFIAEAGDLKCWTGVYRKDISERGYQRILNPEHTAQIKKFLSDERNVIPNSVVLAFNNKFEKNGAKIDAAQFVTAASYHPKDASGTVDEDTTVSSGMLEVFVDPKCLTPPEGSTEITLSEYRSAYTIDGQHRISGGNAVGGSIYIPVTAFLGIDKEEQAFHFIVINRKARKVSKHDIDAVIPKSIYENLQGRLVSAGIVSNDADIVYGLDNLDSSPFKGMISWANNKQPSAIISKGAIDNTLKRVRQLPEDVKETFENEIDLLISVWSGVRKHLEPLWTSKKYVKSPGATYENQLVIKAASVLPALQAAIVTVSESGTISIDDKADDKVKSFEDSVFKYIKSIPLEFFYCIWKKRSITNESAINDLSKLIIKAARTKRVPYGEAGDGWFSPPESIEGLEAKKRADHEVKAAQKKADREAKAAQKKAKLKSKPRAKAVGPQRALKPVRQ